jgi:hypothetical protein
MTGCFIDGELGIGEFWFESTFISFSSTELRENFARSNSLFMKSIPVL